MMVGLQGVGEQGQGYGAGLDPRVLFGERLKLARKAARFRNLSDLSEAIDTVTSRQMIRRFEQGEQLPDSKTLLKLCQVLEVSLDYLLNPMGIRLGQVNFRKHSKASANERDAVIRDVLDYADRYLLIEDLLVAEGLLEAGPPSWDRPEGAPFKVRSPADVEAAAHRVRQAWRLGDDAAPNLTGLLEEHGIKVFPLSLPSSVHGLACKIARPGRQHVQAIVVSGKSSLERQRFTLAHELGHVMMDVHADWDEEKACHRFASAFLMPRTSLLFELGKYRNDFGYEEIIQTKHLYGTSAAALLMRLGDLGVITKHTLERIFRGMGRNWRKREPVPLPLEHSPGRFHLLVLRAVAENVVSLSRAAELLRKDTAEVEQTLFGHED